MSPATTKHI